jgi:Trk-type K+ transport system membrane component
LLESVDLSIRHGQRLVGLLVILFSVTMILPGLVALIYRDGAGRAFSQSAIINVWLKARPAPSR